ncbi:hypothetical protein D1007_44588 [Hordeum vulgare]|nr:hypothetical protein D1007_44588 [Hordeum vulgare]
MRCNSDTSDMTDKCTSSFDDDAPTHADAYTEEGHNRVDDRKGKGPARKCTAAPPQLKGRKQSKSRARSVRHCTIAMKKVRARPRRIPAFGEWNYYDDGGYGYGDGDWPATQTQYLDSAMPAGMVIALPASPKPPKKAVKWIDSGTLEAAVEQRQKVVVGLREEHGAKKPQGKPIEVYLKVSDADAHRTAASRNKTRRARAVKAVDEDLYVIPPDMLCHNNPRRRLTTKRLWTGCLGGLGCVSA